MMGEISCRMQPAQCERVTERVRGPGTERYLPCKGQVWVSAVYVGHVWFVWRAPISARAINNPAGCALLYSYSGRFDGFEYNNFGHALLSYGGLWCTWNVEPGALVA